MNAGRPAREALPWATILSASVLATVAVLTAVLVDYRRTGANPLNLIQPGAAGPSRAAVERDFPGAYLLPGTGHDGQQFYAIARQPLHPRAAAAHLDRPRYRLQRIAYPLLAWALHPSGGGRGLIAAMFAVNIVALVAGGIGTGALAWSLGAPAWLAGLFPALPASYVATRISTGDALALAGAVCALALLQRGRPAGAVAAAVTAVLTRETALLLLAGYAIARRTRAAWLVCAVAATAAAGWAVVLALTVPVHSRQVVELTAPFAGIIRSSRDWLALRELWGLVTVAALALGVLALRRAGLGHPLGPAIALQVILLAVLTRDAVGLSLNATRSASPLLLLATLTLAGRPARAPATPLARPGGRRAPSPGGSPSRPV